MLARPEIFISAASRDLKSCRQLVRDALLTLGCVPVVQEHFPPGAGEVRAMLRERIAGCQAVIHLAGECYGFEPQERFANEPRRSYTQMEYDMARELKKPLYTFLCAPDFPYDAHEAEPPELRALQDAHRVALATGDNLYVPIKSTVELDLRVRELQTRVESLSRDLQRTQHRLRLGVATALAALALIGGAIWLQRLHTARTERQVAQVTDELDRYRQAVKLLADNYGRDIEPGRKLTEEEKFNRALAAVAAQQKVGVGELRSWLAVFVAQVRANPGADFYDRALADFAEKHFADAAANAGKAAAEFHSRREAAEQVAADATQRARDARTGERQALELAGNAEMAAGHYAAALESYRQALALCDKAREGLVWCDRARDDAYALRQMGRYAEAEPLAREVLEQRTRLQGNEHPDTLGSVNHLAAVLYDKGDLTGAETLFRRCLEARERTLGREHPETLQSINNLALILNDKGDLAGAETLFRRCLIAQEHAFGPEHPTTLESANNLALVLVAKGDLAGAEALFRRCLIAQERTLGPEHPTTLGSVSNLANVLSDRGDLAGAETLDRRCLEARERTLGPEHPETLRSANNLALVLAAKGDLTGAEALDRHCLEVRGRTLGIEHPETLASVSNLALVLNDKGDLAGAEALFRRCLETQERTLGPEYPETLSSGSNLAQNLEAAGNYAAAEPLYLRALAGMEHALPPEHPDRLDLDYHFSLLRQEQNRLADALPLAEHAAMGAGKTLPKDSPDRLKYKKNLANLRAKLAAPSPQP